MLRSRKGEKVGFIASAFDLGPHAGHIASLEEAKHHCTYLIVGLHVNPASERETKNRPIPSVSERYISAAACRFVDEVIPYETEKELVNLLQLIQPDMRFLGDDYRGKEFTGKELNIPVVYCSRKHNVSSSAMRERVVEEMKAKGKA
jgi:glycerol-3-phosphate cytidylyltransferase